MIKINLLRAHPHVAGAANVPAESGEAEVSGFDPKQLQKQALINLIIILMGPMGLYLYEQQTIPSLRAKVNQYNQQLGEVASYNSKNAAAVNEIQKFESDRDRIQKQISLLEHLAQQRTKEIMVLDLLQQVIPEKTWLKKVAIISQAPVMAANPAAAAATESYKAIKTLTINGFSLADSEVLDFTEKLQRSTLLENVIPRKTVDVQLEKSTVKEFLIEGKLVNR